MAFLPPPLAAHLRTRALPLRRPRQPPPVPMCTHARQPPPPSGMHAFRIDIRSAHPPHLRLVGYVASRARLHSAVRALCGRSLALAHAHVEHAPYAVGSKADAPPGAQLVLHLRAQSVPEAMAVAAAVARVDDCVVSHVSKMHTVVTRVGDVSVGDGDVAEPFGLRDADGVYGKALADADDWFFQYDCTI